jgi:hypothetical protein
MSSHFGNAEWIMVSDAENAVPVFVKNEGLNGKSTVEIAICLGCTDMIFSEIGNGAFGHLQAAGIRGCLYCVISQVIIALIALLALRWVAADGTGRKPAASQA